jgi:hypothetical protein
MSTVAVDSPIVTSKFNKANCRPNRWLSFAKMDT